MPLCKTYLRVLQSVEASFRGRESPLSIRRSMIDCILLCRYVRPSILKNPKDAGCHLSGDRHNGLAGSTILRMAVKYPKIEFFHLGIMTDSAPGSLDEHIA